MEGLHAAIAAGLDGAVHGLQEVRAHDVVGVENRDVAVVIVAQELAEGIIEGSMLAVAVGRRRQHVRPEALGHVGRSVRAVEDYPDLIEVFRVVLCEQTAYRIADHALLVVRRHHTNEAALRFRFRVGANLPRAVEHEYEDGEDPDSVHECERGIVDPVDVGADAMRPKCEEYRGDDRGNSKDQRRGDRRHPK